MADEELREVAGKPPWPTAADELLWSREEYRIEVLRAASRIAAGIFAGGQNLEVDGKSVGAAPATIDLAEQFARWLEKGER